MFEFFNGERDIRFADFMEGLGYFSLPTDNNVAKTKGIDVICDINGSRKTFNTSILPPLYENIGKPFQVSDRQQTLANAYLKYIYNNKVGARIIPENLEMIRIGIKE